MEQYNKLYQKLDYEQKRIEIREQLGLINKDDTISAIAEAIDRGLLTQNKINKILQAEKQNSMLA
jgi:hypothetical protein